MARLAILLMGFMLLVPGTARAQHSPGPASSENDFGWFALGLGTSIDLDWSGAMTANYGRTRILQLGLYGTGDLLGGDEQSAVALTAGRSAVGRFHRVAALVGPAWVKGQRLGTNGTGRTSGLTTFNTVGGVASAQVIFTPVKEIGVGVNLFTIVSHRASTLGLSFQLVLEGNK